MNLESVEEWVRPAVGALVLLGAAGLLVFVIVRDYRPADPSGFVSVSDRRAAGTDALAPTLGQKGPATVAGNALDNSQGLCGAIAAEFREVRAALARPQDDAENANFKRRFQELRSRAHASKCAVMPEG